MNNRLTRDVREYLKPFGCQTVSVVGLAEGKLRLLVDNSAMATMIRYQQSELLKHLNADPALSITQISVSVSSSLNR